MQPHPANPRIASIADIEAFEAVPVSERLDGVTSTYDVFVRAAALYPDAPALTLHESADPASSAITVTYEQLLARITRTANAFTSAGVTDTDVVTILLPNVIEFHDCLWAAERVAIASPINWMLAAEHIAGIMAATDSRFLVAAAADVNPDIAAKIDEIRAHLAHPITVFTVSSIDTSFADSIRDQPADRLLTERDIHATDIAAYFHTGGTTGLPKIASHTHQNEVVDAHASMWVNDVRAGDTVLVGLPLFHVNSVVITGLASFVAGGHVVNLTAAGYRDKNVIENFWSYVERYRAQWFVGVPTVYAALLAHSASIGDVSSLRFGLCGAAPLPPSIIDEFADRFGVIILEQYGLTEGTAFATSNPRDGERRNGSIGIRIPYLDVRIDATGVLALAGPTVFPGYLRDTDNANAWLDGGFLNTGDLAEMDVDGYIWLKGRAKDIIIRGGHNIDPAIIEAAIAEHPAVELVAAIGRPDDYAGELPIAFVTVKPDYDVTVDELMAHARERVPERAAIPVEITILSQMPVTAVGKIFKPALRDRLKEESA